MRVIIAACVLALSSPATGAVVLQKWDTRFEGGHSFGGYPGPGTEEIQEYSLTRPLPAGFTPDRLRVSWHGTVGQTLSASFVHWIGPVDGEPTDEPYCVSTNERPRLAIQAGAENATFPEMGVGFCLEPGRSARDTDRATARLSFDVESGSDLFDAILEGFPITLYFFDENWWDLEFSSWKRFTYGTGFRGRLMVEAVPEPASLALLGSGALGVVALRRQKQSRVQGR